MSTPPLLADTELASSREAAAATRPRRRPRRRLGSAVPHLVVVVLGVVWAVPLLGLIVTSLRGAGDVANSGWWNAFTQNDWTLQNFRDAFSQGVGSSVVTSLLITVPANVLLVSCSAVVAYALKHMRFIGRGAVTAGILAMLVIPPQITLEPTFRLFQALGLVGKVPAVWIFQAGFTMPLGIFILLAFMNDLPRDIVEAARVDGASEVAIFRRIVLPLISPGLASVLILHFIFSWNDLLVPLLFLQTNSPPLTVLVAGLTQQTNADTTPVVAAAGVVSVLIPVAVMFGLQRYFVRGLTGGALKG